MGMDISFNKEKSLAAGLVTKQTTNGTAEEIACAIRGLNRCKEANVDPDADGYIEWLKEEITLIEVPDTDHCVDADVDNGEFIVRANKWGATYAPLTAFLQKNGIVWNEF